MRCGQPYAETALGASPADRVTVGLSLLDWRPENRNDALLFSLMFRRVTDVDISRGTRQVDSR